MVTRPGRVNMFVASTIDDGHEDEFGPPNWNWYRVVQGVVLFVLSEAETLADSL
jgi:hypothetical protein